MGGGHAGAHLIEQLVRIISIWEERLRREVPAATRESHPVLINTLPALLRQLAEALTPGHPRRTGTEGSTVAEEHGSERMRLTQFRLEDLIIEYKLLREVLLEVLEESGPLTAEERHIVHTSIDESLRKACTAYALVEAELRQRLVATLAHDLRNPLAAARANASLILRKPQSERVPRWAARVADTVDRADRMLQDLLDAMRVQAGGKLPLELEQVDLVEVVRQALENQLGEHGERFVLEAPEQVPGYFSPELLRRAVENLAGNAVKYGSPNRPISVAVRQSHGRVRVMVHNHGDPIPAEEQETLFRAFQRLRTAESGGHRGWGLGLAQVRGAAEAHGGTVSVDSLPERGTTFTIDLPVDARPYVGALTVQPVEG